MEYFEEQGKLNSPKFEKENILNDMNALDFRFPFDEEDEFQEFLFDEEEFEVTELQISVGDENEDNPSGWEGRSVFIDQPFSNITEESKTSGMTVMRELVENSDGSFEYNDLQKNEDDNNISAVATATDNHVVMSGIAVEPTTLIIPSVQEADYNKNQSSFANHQSEKYKQFWEIIDACQKQVNNPSDDNPSDYLTPQQVYNKVAKLFESQEHLKQVQSVFHEEISPSQSQPSSPSVNSVNTANQAAPLTSATTPKRQIPNSPLKLHEAKKLKSSSPPSTPMYIPSVSTSRSTERYTTLNSFEFYTKIKHVVRSKKEYENILRFLHLYNIEVISGAEVVQKLTTILSRDPELLAWFKDFITTGHEKQASSVKRIQPIQSSLNKKKFMDPKEKIPKEIAFSKYKKFDASYYTVADNYVPPKCSGRTSLCNQVLNTVWHSEPTVVTQEAPDEFKEYMGNCEEKKSDLDVQIEANLEAIRCLEAVQKTMITMPQEELKHFQLDDRLGGTSVVIQRAIQSVYQDQGKDIIGKLKKFPRKTVPQVLSELKAMKKLLSTEKQKLDKAWLQQLHIERIYLQSLEKRST